MCSTNTFLPEGSASCFHSCVSVAPLLALCSRLPKSSLTKRSCVPPFPGKAGNEWKTPVPDRGGCWQAPYDCGLAVTTLLPPPQECYLESDQTSLYHAAKGLMTLQALYGTIPQIFGKGECARVRSGMCFWGEGRGALLPKRGVIASCLQISTASPVCEFT